VQQRCKTWQADWQTVEGGGESTGWTVNRRRAAASSSGQPAVHASGREAASSSHQARLPAAAAERQPKVVTAQDTMAAQADSLAEKRNKCKNTMRR
jgi:hypothetical protein